MIRKLATITLSLGLTSAVIAIASDTPTPSGDPDVAFLQRTTAKNVNPNRRPHQDLQGNGEVSRYIVQFEGDAVPLALAKLSQRGQQQPDGSSDTVDMSSSAAQQQISTLQGEQGAILGRISSEAGSVEILRTHQRALNAAVIRMSAVTAQRVQNIPGVLAVERDQAVELSTPDSVPFIGADQLWDGSATSGTPYLGEGIVVGIIDSGINHAHPSFAATGADGYTVVNPLGDGNYLGECVSTPALCNSKLIGAYTFLDAQTSTPPDEILLPGDTPSRDTDGHGSHVASTAAGNVLSNIALPDADGNPGSIVFGQVAGVAPHANLVAFKVCAPSCFFSDIVAAVDQAIADGVVDVLNHSIGSPAGSPWASAQATAFLNARAAGIFVANSAGNSGPGAGTAEAAGNAPWVAGVAATTHDRSYPSKFLQDMTGGDTTPPADITGASVSGGITGDIVYAGDFPTANGSANDTQPEQCLDPFPPGTFTADQIVLCDRGSIARTAKGQNVRDGGAGGFILGNLSGGATSVNADSHVIPAIHIDSDDADDMRTWLATGTDHVGTITSVDTAVTDPAAGDNLAGFSSRGPYTGFDILAPNTAAPGSDILAAGAELTPAQVDLIGILYAGTPSENPSVPGDFGAIGGTSMASPHIAGTAALLKQARPGWSDAEVLSAIMTTGTWDLVKEDGVTPADPFDFGGGRVRVDQAVNAGLLLDETSSNFEAADPALGGDPATLNVAGLVKQNCVLECSWTRTVKATDGGSWTTSTSDPSISVNPTSFSLAAGETQVLEVSVNASGLPTDVWAHGRVNLLPAAGPDQHLTVSFVPTGGEVPTELEITASRDADSFLVQGLMSVEITDMQVAVNGFVAPTETAMSLDQDSDNSTPYDDPTDGADFVLVPIPGGDIRFVAFTEDATTDSPDLDLRVGFDANGNGVPEDFEEICISASASSNETCDISGSAPPGNLWVLVQNWQSSATPPDNAILSTALIAGDAGNVTVDAPTTVPQLTPYDVRLIWDLPPSDVGDRFFGSVTLGSDASNPGNIGTIPVTIVRGPDDVMFEVSDVMPQAGDTLTFSIEVAPNLTPEDRNYTIDAAIPAGFTLVPGSITGGGTESGGVINWGVSQPSLLGTPPTYDVVTSNDNAACAAPFANSGGYVDLEAFAIYPDTSVVGDTVTFTAFGGQNFNFYGETLTGGLNFTDDGFAFFGDPAATGPLPFINQPIPSVADPNSLMAVLWRDFIIPTPSTTPGSVVGVSLATAGPDLSIIEYDNLESWPGGGGDSIDIQVAIRGAANNSPDVFEIIFAFDNVNDGGNPFGTIGVEDATGTNGTQYAFDNVAVTDGMAICFDLAGPSLDPVVLTYQVTVDPGTEGSTITSTMENDVDSVGAELVTETIDVEVGLPPIPGDVNGDGVVDRADLNLILAARNQPATGPDDPRDMNGDGVINALDARLLVLACDLPRCATPVP